MDLRPIEVFISYRRGISSGYARLLFEKLTDSGYPVFFDREYLPANCVGQAYWDTIKEKIDSSEDFILLLSPGSLAKYSKKLESGEEDVFVKEISYALEKKKRNPNFQIIPVFIDGFAYQTKTNTPEDANRDIIPDEIKTLGDFQVFTFNVEEGFSDSYKTLLSKITAKAIDDNVYRCLAEIRECVVNIIMEDGQNVILPKVRTLLQDFLDNNAQLLRRATISSKESRPTISPENVQSSQKIIKYADPTFEPNTAANLEKFRELKEQTGRKPKPVDVTIIFVFERNPTDYSTKERQHIFSEMNAYRAAGATVRMLTPDSGIYGVEAIVIYDDSTYIRDTRYGAHESGVDVSKEKINHFNDLLRRSQPYN